MNKRVIILGANGRFGRAAAKEFMNSRWQVSLLTRSGQPIAGLDGANYVACDAMDRESLIRACKDHDVIVNAVNPPYENWASMLPTITGNVIDAAVTHKATVCIPGNVYVYGNPIPPTLEECTPLVANTKKGHLRIEMEDAYRHAAERGLRTIVLRGGDFIEGKDTGNWFETYIAGSAHRGKLTYPGQYDIEHSWAYLPDMARALVGIIEKRDLLKPFEEFGFEGYSLKATDLANAAEKTFGRTVRIASFPWIAVRLMALFSRSISEVIEMRYLWQQPHRINGRKLARLLPEFYPTPVEVALERTLNEIREANYKGKTETTTSGGRVQPDPAR